MADPGQFSSFAFFWNRCTAVEHSGGHRRVTPTAEMGNDLLGLTRSFISGTLIMLCSNCCATIEVSDLLIKSHRPLAARLCCWSLSSIQACRAACSHSFRCHSRQPHRPGERTLDDPASTVWPQAESLDNIRADRARAFAVTLNILCTSPMAAQGCMCWHGCGVNIENTQASGTLLNQAWDVDSTAYESR